MPEIFPWDTQPECKHGGAGLTPDVWLCPHLSPQFSRMGWFDIEGILYESVRCSWCVGFKSWHIAGGRAAG